MNRLVYLLGIHLFLATQAIAGSVFTGDRTEIDSLLKQLPQSNPKQKIEILLNLSNQYLSLSTDSSKEYAMMALINAKEINDPSLHCQCL